MMTVIPDAITPIEGWRAFRLSRDRVLLCSIHNPMFWEPGTPVEATCRVDPPRERKWEIDREPNGSEVRAIQQWWDGPQGASLVAHPGQIYNAPYVTATAASFSTSSTPIGSLRIEKLEPPKVALPVHLRWFYREIVHRHDAPFEQCSCGIYMAKDIATAQVYTTGSEDAVIGKVAGWGRTIEGVDGYRVQYAYPIELYVTSKQAKNIEDYGVPLILDREPGGSEPEPEPSAEPPAPDPELVVEATEQSGWLQKIFTHRGSS